MARQNVARQLKCYQALLSSYFAFALYDEKIPKAAQEGWEVLRDWLAKNQRQLQHAGENRKLRLPSWFTVLTRHVNLLTTAPCDRYGADLLHGNGSMLEEARHGFGLSGDSWVMEEAILAQMRAAEDRKSVV